MILAALTISTTFLFELPAVKCRQTNVDLIAAQLSSELAPNDYVIIHPFFCSVTFNRYYKATASWTTLPPLDDPASFSPDDAATMVCPRLSSITCA